MFCAEIVSYRARPAIQNVYKMIRSEPGVDGLCTRHSQNGRHDSIFPLKLPQINNGSHVRPRVTQLEGQTANNNEDEREVKSRQKSEDQSEKNSKEKGMVKEVDQKGGV